MRLLDQSSLILKLVFGCARKLFVGRIQIGHTYFLPPQVCGRSWWGCQLCDFTYCHQLIYWLKVNLAKFAQLVLVVKVGKFSVVYLCFGPRGTNAHWNNPLYSFVSDLKISKKRSSGFCCQCFDNFSVVKIGFVPRGTKSHWVNPLICVCFVLRSLVTFSCLWIFVRFYSQTKG